ncbi:hypothetical protein PHPALM_29923 [Phytophthora palmivora]|uniref:Uncharacterized protein n=1 Tax=Phytophthora palmivora TaxID=4796 RepID=A0A2P4X6E8_9STRA|nr:hypothetical protein PHPALM_29923 [Phytophthora palmivora]
MTDCGLQTASILAQIIDVGFQLMDLVGPTIEISVEIGDLGFQGRDLGCRLRRLQTDNAIGFQGGLEGITLLSEAMNFSPIMPDLPTLGSTHHLERLERANMLTIAIHGLIGPAGGQPEIVAQTQHSTTQGDHRSTQIFR